MCIGVSYSVESKKEIKVYFPNPQAQLPILLKDSAITYLPWGRRKQQSGKLPLGGWARHDSILAGKWDYTNPKPVKLKVLAFAEKDSQKQTHWFDIESESYIQGLVAHFDNEYRVYVVTVQPNFKAIHDRWPRIISTAGL